MVERSFSQLTQPTQSVHDDCVQLYACDVLTIGFFIMEFIDAIHEGDGTRVIRCWRYLLPIFKASNQTNYAIEAFRLLAQFDYLLAHQLAWQHAWSRQLIHMEDLENMYPVNWKCFRSGCLYFREF